eukprot:CAMPEP_0116834720 /NCGR_PEP_ID=MMETSP0418-20121206/7143_1 /TAXON_ID=1158023 /ORGANISM="Astrosyne radiata, Strain 13vi08-1A" /LENGTH=281 /DNA_ID=CAMNT_0004464301 /DNA_START=78 /DNA_END=923 /DNA_ORIENTATION=+
MMVRYHHVCSAALISFYIGGTRSFLPSLAAAKRSFALDMTRNRGLEIGWEGATPTAGGMILYTKAGPDGESLGDCPFSHYIQMVLREKDLEYEVEPCTQSTKPRWLIDFYGGKMPALQHKDECYTESDVIAQYLDFFFQEPPLTLSKASTAIAKNATEGFFPAVAQYLKHTLDGDEDDLERKANLEKVLERLNTHLEQEGRTGPYLVDNGEKITLQDCALAPKLYHMKIGLKAFKDNAIDVATQFPAVHLYMESVFSRKSFVDSLYPEETVVWGWTNARGQ